MSHGEIVELLDTLFRDVQYAEQFCLDAKSEIPFAARQRIRATFAFIDGAVSVMMDDRIGKGSLPRRANDTSDGKARVARDGRRNFHLEADRAQP